MLGLCIRVEPEEVMFMFVNAGPVRLARRTGHTQSKPAAPASRTAPGGASVLPKVMAIVLQLAAAEGNMKPTPDGSWLDHDGG